MFLEYALPLTLIPLIGTLIWCWPQIRAALRVPSAAKIATDSVVGLAQIALPASWKQTYSLQNATLEAMDRFRGRYLSVISEPLDDFEAQVGLLEYADLVMSDRLRIIRRCSTSTPRVSAACVSPISLPSFKARVRSTRWSAGRYHRGTTAVLSRRWWTASRSVRASLPNVPRLLRHPNRQRLPLATRSISKLHGLRLISVALANAVKPRRSEHKRARTVAGRRSPVF